MPRIPRYLLIWLSCTAASVTAVLVTVQFVVGSTRHTPPVARSAPMVFDSPPAWQAGQGQSPSPQSPSPSASGSPTATGQPSPSASTPTPAKASTGTPRTTAPKPSVDCEEGGPGLHTVPSQGGKVTVRYGSRGVCLISAIPGRGFKATTSQTADDTLTVTFTSADHRSVITATIDPVAKASVRETSF
ncbi:MULTISPECIES: hypothetical protein [unclassified Streptomyces]|uniref:hypothetical protein n=1 Tax=unclassified Streptomyces TaxID=2593676 RepID=UPI002035E515|nr:MULTISPECIES: hypothetical protein [unclassified Streptomyces]MCX5015460.1 hypothetical protein [Streptomyces sp. NBC_00555]UUU43795.1 hypothetical protein JIW86_36250 [Streptomyces sp. NBC_00162]